MGDHYIPQFYLRGFTEAPEVDLVWVYRKGGEEPFKTSIRNIAQENQFYSPETEKYLANEIEWPASKIIQKIRGQRPITHEDKVTLSKYMVVMWKRVPRCKRWVTDKAPEIMAPVFDRFDNELAELGKQNPSKIDLVERRRKELRELRESKEDKFVSDMWLESIPPDKTPQSVNILSQMTWGFLTAGSGQYFITSDNPLFFFPEIGIGRKESEVSFPIAKNIALLATWRIDIGEGFFPARDRVVKEINQRTASISTKFLYGPYQEAWIQALANKGKFNLNRIDFKGHAT
ncbi:MAG: DUF4238 domain-containing protein [Desulforhabdus sp.]|jgi:hypothetical protein|nr:DUF4238 domain-containing protein [Desulforhabdus sp.]